MSTASFAVAPSAPQLPDLNSVLNEAGVGQQAKAYIAARGITSTAVLATLSKDSDAYVDKFVTKFIQGLTINGSEVKFVGTDEEREVMEATLIVARDISVAHHKAYISAAVHQATAAMVASAAVVTSAAPTTVSTKVPVQLPAGVWTALVHRYNSVQTGGRDRSLANFWWARKRSLPGATMNIQCQRFTRPSCSAR